MTAEWLLGMEYKSPQREGGSSVLACKRSRPSKVVGALEAGLNIVSDGAGSGRHRPAIRQNIVPAHG
jgi:hypothetical protein